MSNRTLVELNHDYCPGDNTHELTRWASQMQAFMRSGDKGMLPQGVTFKVMRHHSEPDLLERVTDLEKQLAAREAQLQAIMQKLIAIIPTAIGLTGDELGEIVETIRDGKAALRAYVEGLLPPKKKTGYLVGDDRVSNYKDIGWNACIEQVRENLNKSLEGK